MKNDEGTWFVTTPGSTIVHRSNKDLEVICKKLGMDVGNANVVSRTKGNMFGNIILGGGVGAIIDHNNGSAYEYPSIIKIFMGRSVKIDGNTSAAVEVKPQNDTIPNKPETKATASVENSDLLAHENSKKLRELQTLQNDGVISKEEYETKKKEILQRM